MRKYFIFIGFIVNLNMVHASTVGVHYYIQNHRNELVNVKINELETISIEAKQRTYKEIAKTKLSANIFKSMRHETNYRVESNEGDVLCETKLDIGTYWNAGPRIAEMKIVNKNGSDRDCVVDYGETYDTLNSESQTTEVSYQIFYDIY